MVNLDYFYGSEGEQYRFYQIPAVLLEDDEYKKISDTAKILYGILLSRLAMSKKNNWIEEDTNRVYILYNRNDIAKKMGRSPNTISNAMNQLLEVGLIKRKRQGQGKADMLYVMNFSSREHNKKIDMPCKEEKEVSVSSDQPHSFYENREEKVYTNDIDIPSPQNKRTAYREIIKKQVDYEILRQSSYDMNIIDNIVEVMLNVYASQKECINISGDMIPLNEVINRLKRINFTHVQYVMECIGKSITSIHRPNNYLLAALYTQLFTVLKRIADNRRNGQLPIHVRLWADEYYAGPKPLNCETLLGEIRSRNMSIIPILQDIAQIKTLYPNDKWEIFTGNCATTVFLGSGATAHTTHQWVSDMLEDMTIDSRSENLGHSQGGGNLQMNKAGMKLMTPGQISRLPKDDCILFLKGERPIYDKKNWSFTTESFKEAERIAGENGYKNPVYVTYDENNKKYITTRFESRLNYISQEEFEFYEKKSKKDDSIQTFQMDEEAFLYLNFNETPQPSLRELEKMVQEIKVSKINEEEEEKKREEDTVEDREKWDLSGDIIDCFQRYSGKLSAEEQEEIIKGIEEGLTDQEVKRYFILYGADKMRQYRRVLTARKNRT